MLWNMFMEIFMSFKSSRIFCKSIAHSLAECHLAYEYRERNEFTGSRSHRPRVSNPKFEKKETIISRMITLEKKISFATEVETLGHIVELVYFLHLFFYRHFIVFHIAKWL